MKDTHDNHSFCLNAIYRLCDLISINRAALLLNEFERFMHLIKYAFLFIEIKLK